MEREGSTWNACRFKMELGGTMAAVPQWGCGGTEEEDEEVPKEERGEGEGRDGAGSGGGGCACRRGSSWEGEEEGSSVRRRRSFGGWDKGEADREDSSTSASSSTLDAFLRSSLEVCNRSGEGRREETDVEEKDSGEKVVHVDAGETTIEKRGEWEREAGSLWTTEVEEVVVVVDEFGGGVVALGGCRAHVGSARRNFGGVLSVSEEDGTSSMCNYGLLVCLGGEVTIDRRIYCTFILLHSAETDNTNHTEVKRRRRGEKEKIFPVWIAARGTILKKKNERKREKGEKKRPGRKKREKKKTNK